MRLILVRHGETTWNAEHRLQGQADAPLSEKGKAQAASLAPAFANGLAPDLAVASDLPRTRETARLIGFPDAEPDARWREIDVGTWTAKRIEDIRAGDEAAYKGWRAGTYTPEGGESWAAFRARIEGAIRDVAARCSGTALVVAHGGVIRAACETLVGLAPARVVPVGPATATIFEVSLDEGALAGKLEGYNLSPREARLGAPD